MFHEILLGGAFTAADQSIVTTQFVKEKGNGTNLNLEYPSAGFTNGKFYTRYLIVYKAYFWTTNSFEFSEIVHRAIELYYESTDAATVIGNLDTIFLGGGNAYLAIATN